jgi:hypothetical protein
MIISCSVVLLTYLLRPASTYRTRRPQKFYPLFPNDQGVCVCVINTISLELKAKVQSDQEHIFS